MKNIGINVCVIYSMPVALIVFDSAVNQGTDAATMLLTAKIAVKVDGVIGDKTLSAANNRTVFNIQLEILQCFE